MEVKWNINSMAKFVSLNTRKEGISFERGTRKRRRARQRESLKVALVNVATVRRKRRAALGGRLDKEVK